MSPRTRGLLLLVVALGSSVALVRASIARGGLDRGRASSRTPAARVRRPAQPAPPARSSGSC